MPVVMLFLVDDGDGLVATLALILIHPAYLESLNRRKGCSEYGYVDLEQYI